MKLKLLIVSCLAIASLLSVLLILSDSKGSRRAITIKFGETPSNYYRSSNVIMMASGINGRAYILINNDKGPRLNLMMADDIKRIYVSFMADHTDIRATNFHFEKTSGGIDIYGIWVDFIKNL